MENSDKNPENLENSEKNSDFDFVTLISVESREICGGSSSGQVVVSGSSRWTGEDSRNPARLQVLG